jgi:hypothetical protein
MRLPCSACRTQQPITFPELPKEYPNRFREALQASTDALFSGEDPQVRDGLLALQETLACCAADVELHLLLLLGLASELAGG